MLNSHTIFAYEDLIGHSLSEIATSERVVIFSSGITDMRMIMKFLAERGIPFKVIEMEMGSVQNRAAFRNLCRMTDWNLLPQIFIGGTFIGGLDEFFEHPAIISNYHMISRPDEETLQ